MEVHPQAIYTSRLLDCKNLPEPQNSKEINDWFYSSKIKDYSLELKLQNTTDNSEVTNELDINIEPGMSTEELANRTKRQLSLNSQTNIYQEKTKLTRVEENKEIQEEPMEIDSYQNQIQQPPK
jgi:ribulose 1,5-bisphosphate carboxylase large subunit-like protein